MTVPWKKRGEGDETIITRSLLPHLFPSLLPRPADPEEPFLFSRLAFGTAAESSSVPGRWRRAEGGRGLFAEQRSEGGEREGEERADVTWCGWRGWRGVTFRLSRAL